MRQLVTKIICFALVLGSLASYQVAGEVRARNTEIRELTLELEAREEELQVLKDGMQEVRELLEEAKAEEAAKTAEAAVAKEAAELAAQEEEERGPYADGVYTGSGQGYGGPIEVQVTVAGGYLTEIEVLSHKDEDEVYFGIALDLIPKILEAQDPEVDSVSGATFSSGGIKAAVADAISQAQ